LNSPGRWKISFREASAIAILGSRDNGTVETTQSLYDTLRRPRGRRVVSEAPVHHDLRRRDPNAEICI